MREKSIFRIKGIGQVIGVVILHMLIINFLNIKISNWEGEEIKLIILIYCIPIILMYITCMMSLKAKKVKYNLFWLIISLFPSTFILFYLKDIQGNKANVPGIVDTSYFNFNFDKGQIELMFLFPLTYLVIQLIFIGFDVDYEANKIIFSNSI
ncbi:hypothetical protein [Paenibacillus donghaensis]|uniref:hypothetical protein n=1 Tax=Paenibacillus donghaensis TaxID=414771 RepID=UPI0012FBC8B0|nr:hypothetical protein [Paenibacillus donghaensis]